MFPDAVLASMSEVTQSDVEVLGLGGAPILVCAEVCRLQTDMAQLNLALRKARGFTQQILFNLTIYTDASSHSL